MHYHYILKSASINFINNNAITVITQKALLMCSSAFLFLKGHIDNYEIIYITD